MPSPVEIADANVLIALTLPAHVHHEPARRWVSQVALFATTPLTETALVRLLLNTTITVGKNGQALTIDHAVSALQAIKALPNADFIADATSLADSRALTSHVTRHRQVTDTHLLNLAIARGGVLATFDARIRDALKPRHRHHVHTITT
ncbi:TA system VapC family ribonuclease toxin [Pseudactinotalea terrae]|uniref:TA system VapC family ribonuclease toxin n=1 Tax=Pseudactinotalea terrae TaxID=1743262 RepID=UPI0012E296E5|nr:TA system VapC family ribonuclease toxin [Pseudactinotalea terrae]